MSVKNLVTEPFCGTPLREQVDAACDAYRQSEAAKEKRAEILRKTHGYMSQADGECFEQAVALELEMPLVTRDAHFDRIEGLAVIHC